MNAVLERTDERPHRHPRKISREPIRWRGAMETQAARAKGIAFKELLAWLDRKLGRDRLLYAVARLSPEYQGIIALDTANFGILSSSWYPLPCVHQLLDGLTVSMSRSARYALAQE